jgi:hypothetical protein
MKKIIKKILGITKLEEKIINLQLRIIQHEEFVINKMAELKEYTRVDADVGIRGNNTIILTGVYHKKAYVQFWDIGDGEFEKLADYLRHMQNYALLRNIDAPPMFKGMFNLN